MTPNSGNPLYDEHAEQAVLGTMLQDNAAIPEVVEVLTQDSEVFYGTAHQIVYAAILAVYHEKRDVDALMVADYIKRQGESERIGGLVYLYDLVESVPVTANVLHYAQLVKEKATRRGMYSVGRELAEHAKDGQQPPESSINAMQQKLSLLVNPANAKGSRLAQDSIQEVLANIEQLYNGEKPPGLATGFDDFDLLTCGLQPADLILIAARPSMGKSILAHNIMCHVALQLNKPIALFSLEMSRESVLQRMLAAEGAIDFGRIRTGNLAADEWPKLTHAASALHAAPLVINDTASILLLDFRAECRRLKAQYPELATIIVDYLQLIRVSQRGSDAYQDTTEISHTLKDIARELNVPMVALSQLSRAIEKRPDPRPQLSDLRESGSLEQDADVVAFIHRDDYYLASHMGVESKEAELIIKKQRNGPTGTIKLNFNRRQMRFSNLRAEF